MAEEEDVQKNAGPPLRERTELRQGLLEAAKEASLQPGVYLMKDVEGSILYVGKAKNLRNRLLQYFQPRIHEVMRIELMLSQVQRFDVILTETENEALLLECTLIKRHKPRFNIRLKDDKSYPYLKVNLGTPFPRIEWTRKVLRDGARYFGPFPSSWSARQVLQLLTESFQLRDCSDNTFRHRSRPCLLFQMGRCSAPCVGKISAEAYATSVREAVGVLEGKGDRLIAQLQSEMLEAADSEEFELAAFFRDQIQAIDAVTALQGVDEAGSERNRDVVALVLREAEAHGVILLIRGGRMISVRHLVIQNSDASLPKEEVLRDFLAQHYVGRESGEEAGQTGDTSGSPREILVPYAPTDLELLERALGTGFRVPESEADRRILNVARSNAEYSLEQAKKRNFGHGVESLEQVQAKLDLPKLPTRIECYDISNFQGGESVASRVVFIEGAPDKNLYRRYKIQTVEGQNDFAMMREVLGRRFSKTEEDLPDLVVVDGGKGQLSQAVAIFEELGLQGVAVVGLAKARTQSDFRSSEVKSSEERIFIPGRKNPLALHSHQPAYKLLTHVRDEAHRFAISYHRLLRDKKSLRTQED